MSPNARALRMSLGSTSRAQQAPRCRQSDHHRYLSQFLLLRLRLLLLLLLRPFLHLLLHLLVLLLLHPLQANRRQIAPARILQPK